MDLTGCTTLHMNTALLESLRAQAEGTRGPRLQLEPSPALTFYGVPIVLDDRLPDMFMLAIHQDGSIQVITVAPASSAQPPAGSVSLPQ
jgi:hypothetical protein